MNRGKQQNRIASSTRTPPIKYILQNQDWSFPESTTNVSPAVDSICYLGLTYSDVFKSFGIYVREGPYSFAQLHPDIARFETALSLAYGSVGLFAGIIATIGGKTRKSKAVSYW